MWIVAKQILIGAVLPGTLALLALLAARRPWAVEAPAPEPEGSSEAPPPDSPAEERGRWGDALGLGGGYAASQWAIKGAPTLSFVHSENKFFALAMAAVAWGLLLALWKAPAWARRAARIVLALALPCFVLLSLPEGSRPGVPALAGLGAAVAALWLALDFFAEKAPGASVPMSLALVCGASAGALAWFGNTAFYGQCAGALGAALGACVLVAWWRPSFSLGPGGVAAFALLLPALLMSGCCLGDMPAGPAWMLGAAPLACGLRALKPLRKLRPWLATVLVVAAVGSICAGAGGLAWALAETPDASGYADLPY